MSNLAHQEVKTINIPSTTMALYIILPIRSLKPNSNQTITVWTDGGVSSSARTMSKLQYHHHQWRSIPKRTVPMLETHSLIAHPVMLTQLSKKSDILIQRHLLYRQEVKMHMFPAYKGSYELFHILL